MYPLKKKLWHSNHSLNLQQQISMRSDKNSSTVLRQTSQMVWNAEYILSGPPPVMSEIDNTA